MDVLLVTSQTLPGWPAILGVQWKAQIYRKGLFYFSTSAKTTTTTTKQRFSGVSIVPQNLCYCTSSANAQACYNILVCTCVCVHRQVCHYYCDNITQSLAHEAHTWNNYMHTWNNYMHTIILFVHTTALLNLICAHHSTVESNLCTPQHCWI